MSESQSGKICDKMSRSMAQARLDCISVSNDCIIIISISWQFIITNKPQETETVELFYELWSRWCYLVMTASTSPLHKYEYNKKIAGLVYHNVSLLLFYNFYKSCHFWVEWEYLRNSWHLGTVEKLSGIKFSKVFLLIINSDLGQVGYDRRVRPNYGGPPVSVGVSLYVLNVGEISYKFMDFTFDMYFRWYW